MTAYAYLRKSVVQPNVRTISWEMQEIAVRELAQRGGDTDLTLLSDWNKSGRLGPESRPGYRDLLTAIESGRCTVLYAYSLSRLSRSLVEYASLAALCVEHSVRVRFAKEGEMDFTTPSGRLMLTILVAFAQMEAELAQERAKDAVAARRARGDRIGPARYGARPGEDLAAVVDAYNEAGSLQGAARLLTTSGVKTRQGGIWRTSSVRVVLQKAAPDILAPTREKGVRAKQPYLLARLLRCHCGQMLSPQAAHGGRGRTDRYWCSRAAETPGHTTPRSVAESVVLPWVQTEVDGAGPDDRDIALAGAADERREAIQKRVHRNAVMYEAGDLDEAEYRARRKTLNDELGKLDAEGRMLRLEPIDWERDAPQQINGWLRALVEYVQLDEALRPVYAKWRVPSWRRVPPAA